MLIGAGAGTADELKKVRAGTWVGPVRPFDRGPGPGSRQTCVRRILDGKNAVGQPNPIREPDHRLPDAERLDDAAQLYDSPFTDFSPRGVEGVFDPKQVTQLLAFWMKSVKVLLFRARAVAVRKMTSDE